MARHRQRGGDLSLFMPLIIAIVAIGVIIGIGFAVSSASKRSGPPPSISPIGPSHSIMPGPSPPS